MGASALSVVELLDWCIFRGLVGQKERSRRRKCSTSSKRSSKQPQKAADVTWDPDDSSECDLSPTGARLGSSPDLLYHQDAEPCWVTRSSARASWPGYRNSRMRTARRPSGTIRKWLGKRRKSRQHKPSTGSHPDLPVDRENVEMTHVTSSRDTNQNEV